MKHIWWTYKWMFGHRQSINDGPIYSMTKWLNNNLRIIWTSNDWFMFYDVMMDGGWVKNWIKLINFIHEWWIKLGKLSFFCTTNSKAYSKWFFSYVLSSMDVIYNINLDTSWLRWRNFVKYLDPKSNKE